MTNRKNAFSRGLFRALLLLLALSVFSGCAGQGNADGTSLPAASDTGPDVTETAAAGPQEMLRRFRDLLFVRDVLREEKAYQAVPRVRPDLLSGFQVRGIQPRFQIFQVHSAAPPPVLCAFVRCFRDQFPYFASSSGAPRTKL